jgi:hypothetical protein
MFCAIRNLLNTNDDAVYISYDGYNWENKSNVGLLTQYWDICWSHELGMFAAVSGKSNYIVTSKDGLTWNKISIPSGLNLYTICYSPELHMFCAPSSYSNGNDILISTDGVTWTVKTDVFSSASQNWRNIC